MAETKKYTYKSKNGRDYFIPGFGRSKNGIISTNQPFENPNFELVENAQEAAPAAQNPAPAPAPQPAPAHPQAATPEQPTQKASA